MKSMSSKLIFRKKKPSNSFPVISLFKKKVSDEGLLFRLSMENKKRREEKKRFFFMNG
jgi:hypothetical protein